MQFDPSLQRPDPFHPSDTLAPGTASVAGSWPVPPEALGRGGCAGCSRAPAIAGGVRSSSNRDLSLPVFTPGYGTGVSEMLQALPMVKGGPLAALSQVGAAGAYTLKVEVQRPNATPDPTSIFYDFSHTPKTLATEALEPSRTIVLARAGIALKVPAIDATANRSPTNPSAWQIRAAATAILRGLDATLAEGTGSGGAGNADDFVGLMALASQQAFTSRTGASSTDLEQDARNALSQISPTGRGAGEGPCCLAGGPNVLRALMATASGQAHGSGWRRDDRTGLRVYHYLGVPFYRTNTDESSTPPLYALNLGPTGACLVHAYGSADSYGLELEEQPLDVANGFRRYLLHGAFALMVWEPEAYYQITNVPTTSQ